MDDEAQGGHQLRSHLDGHEPPAVRAGKLQWHQVARRGSSRHRRHLGWHLALHAPGRRRLQDRGAEHRPGALRRRRGVGRELPRERGAWRRARHGLLDGARGGRAQHDSGHHPGAHNGADYPGDNYRGQRDLALFGGRAGTHRGPELARRRDARRRQRRIRPLPLRDDGRELGRGLRRARYGRRTQRLLVDVHTQGRRHVPHRERGRPARLVRREGADAGQRRRRRRPAERRRRGWQLGDHPFGRRHLPAPKPVLAPRPVRLSRNGRRPRKRACRAGGCLALPQHPGGARVDGGDDRLHNSSDDGAGVDGSDGRFDDRARGPPVGRRRCPHRQRGHGPGAVRGRRR
mmetsp:Transcript_114746/g.329564  ORF Transcript_114746/g.329564 Transcript_114746/m.329564 type:complete len:346 (-) Transcript_114746:1345-2382(-)